MNATDNAQVAKLLQELKRLRKEGTTDAFGKLRKPVKQAFRQLQGILGTDFPKTPNGVILLIADAEDQLDSR